MKNFVQHLLDLFYPIFRKLMPFEVFAYLTLGAANTAFNILLFALLFNFCDHTPEEFYLKGVAVEVATIVSFLVTVVSGYWLNKNFAFASAENNKKENANQFRKYFLVSIQGQFSDYLITKGLIALLLLNPVIAYFISTFIMLIINFLLQKYYTFKKRSTAF